MRILVTGGCGFIGSNFLNMMVTRFPNYLFYNIDKVTYAANVNNTKEIQDCSNYQFIKLDIVNRTMLEIKVKEIRPDIVVHFAAETHVDRSISCPEQFIYSNVIGTFNLLEVCRLLWNESMNSKTFVHISTDEVYGSLNETGHFTEMNRYDPSSPYSASKAASDHIVKSYYKTYGLPVKITNCSNNYGPRQSNDKFIPRMISNILKGEELPIYGDGENVRDWLFVDDHCDAIWKVIEKGKYGESYNIGGNSELSNIELIKNICKVMSERLEVEYSTLEQLIKFVPDRLGHDFRYAIDSTKIRTSLNWVPNETFESGLDKTISWYIDNISKLS